MQYVSCIVHDRSQFIRPTPFFFSHLVSESGRDGLTTLFVQIHRPRRVYELLPYMLQYLRPHQAAFLSLTSCSGGGAFQISSSSHCIFVPLAAFCHSAEFI